MELEKAIQALENENIPMFRKAGLAEMHHFGSHGPCGVSGSSVQTLITPSGRKVSLPSWFLELETTASTLANAVVALEPFCVEDSEGRSVSQKTLMYYYHVGIWG